VAYGQEADGWLDGWLLTWSLRSRRLFQTTKTDDSVMVAAATSGLRNPAAASGMAARL
jgi:hypothetical protein